MFLDTVDDTFFTCIFVRDPCLQFSYPVMSASGFTISIMLALLPKLGSIPFVCVF